MPISSAVATRGVLLDTLLERGVEESLARRCVEILAEEESRRLRCAKAKYTVAVYREEEIEISLDVEFEGADPSVGIMSGGAAIYGAVRLDNGERVELSEEEVRRFEEALMEESAEREYDRYEDHDTGIDD